MLVPDAAPRRSSTAGFAALPQRDAPRKWWRWLAVALVLAACGLFASTSHDPVWSFASICFAALGFKAASSLFWPIPQGYLDTRVAAAVIALINSVGNLGGFVAPTAFGYLKQHTGSITGGLYALAIASLVAAVAALFARTHRRSDPPRGLPADASFTNASMLRHAEH